MFADRTVSHWASLLSTLIVNGESATCYDEQYFFDTDHSEGESGTQSNVISAAKRARAWCCRISVGLRSWKASLLRQSSPCRMDLRGHARQGGLASAGAQTETALHRE